VRDGLLVACETRDVLLGSGSERSVGELRRPEEEGVVVGSGDHGFGRVGDVSLVASESERLSCERRLDKKRRGESQTRDEEGRIGRSRSGKERKVATNLPRRPWSFVPHGRKVQFGGHDRY